MSPKQVAITFGVALAAGLIWVLWLIPQESHVPIARQVEVRDRFVGTVTILNGHVAGCVRPLHGKTVTCGYFIQAKVQAWPKVGQRVNVAIIDVPSKDDSSYPEILIYPDLAPTGVF